MHLYVATVEVGTFSKQFLANKYKKMKFEVSKLKQTYIFGLY